MKPTGIIVNSSEKMHRTCIVVVAVLRRLKRICQIQHRHTVKKRFFFVTHTQTRFLKLFIFFKALDSDSDQRRINEIIEKKIKRKKSSRDVLKVITMNFLSSNNF